MPRPLVLALDVGTSSVRASVYGADLQPRHSIQIRYRWAVTSADGRVEGDPRHLAATLAEAIDRALEQVRQPIAAVHTAAFWHSLLGVDRRGRPVTPLLPWSDVRASKQALRLQSTLDERAVHRRTGCRLHVSYWPARLRWFRQHDRKLFAHVARWVSFTEFLEEQWLGRDAVSISQASGTGLMIQDSCRWDPALLDACQIDERRLSRIVDLDEPGELSPTMKRRWPLLSAARWVPAAGDGALNNVGAGCVGRERAAVMIGTSGALRVLWKAPRGTVRVPFGLWRYRLDRAHPIVGGALSNGGNVREWLLRMLAGRQEDPTVHRTEQDALQRLADAVPPDAHGLTILPFLAGTRSPDYLVDARGTIHGLTLATRREDLLRAGMEAVAYGFAAIADQLSAVATPRELVAAGGGLERSSAWTQILADVLGQSIRWCPALELTSRGAAAVALAQIGALRLEEVQPPAGRQIRPDPKRRRIYDAARARQSKLMSALNG